MSIITTGRLAPGLDKGYPKVSRRLEGSRIVRETQLRVLFHTDDPQETGIALEQQIYTLYPEFTVGFDLGGGFTIRSTTLSRDERNRLLHYLDVKGDTQVTDKEKEDKDKPPDQRRSQWSWDFETLEFALTQDIDGNAIQTTAGDPIEVTYGVPIPVLTVEKQQANFDPDTIIDYVNHVNDAAFWGAPAGAALMAGIRERKGETFNGVEYRAVSYVIKFALPDIPGVLEGWKLKLLNHGPNYIVNGEVTAIKDETGSKITRNITAGGTGLIDPGDPPHILSFNQYKEADFSLLNINWPLT